MGEPRYALTDTFRANLRSARRRADLSQEELAALASVHRTEIGLLETGARVPRIDTLVKLAGALEVTPEDLLEGIEWLPAPPRAEGRFRVPGPVETGRQSDG